MAARPGRNTLSPNRPGLRAYERGEAARRLAPRALPQRWADRIYASRSSDRGRCWSVPVPTELPNNNSSIQFTSMANGHLALVFNNSSAAQATDRRASLYDDIEDDGDAAASAALPAGVPQAFWGAPRAPLTLAISEDGGRHLAPSPRPGGRRRLLHDPQLPGKAQTGNTPTRRSSRGRTASGTSPSPIYRQAIKYVRVTEDWGPVLTRASGDPP